MQHVGFKAKIPVAAEPGSPCRGQVKTPAAPGGSKASVTSLWPASLATAGETDVPQPEMSENDTSSGGSAGGATNLRAGRKSETKLSRLVPPREIPVTSSSDSGGCGGHQTSPLQETILGSQ